MFNIETIFCLLEYITNLLKLMNKMLSTSSLYKACKVLWRAAELRRRNGCIGNVMHVFIEQNWSEIGGSSRWSTSFWHLTCLSNTELLTAVHLQDACLVTSDMVERKFTWQRQWEMSSKASPTGICCFALATAPCTERPGYKSTDILQ